MIVENQHTEFKSSFNDAVVETLSAFVNTKGGEVYVGLDDKGIPVANFSIGKETVQNWINETHIKKYFSSNKMKKWVPDNQNLNTFSEEIKNKTQPSLQI